MAGLPPRKPEPARGAMAGIKADLQAAKARGEAYDPRGHGNAYTHNFLNQKPWHPMNFRNQMKKYEAEQQAVADQKAKEQGQAEFEAEQEMMKTLSYLSAEEQQRWKDRQSISFMYTKPPGLEAALARDAAEATKKAAEAAAAASAAAGGASSSGAVVPAAAGAAAPVAAAPAPAGAATGQAPVPHAAAGPHVDLDRMREDPVALMLKARANLAQNERFVVKHGVGISAHGGFSGKDNNQQLLEDEPRSMPAPAPAPAAALQGPAGVVADAEDVALLASMTEDERAAVLRKLRKMQKEAEKQQRLQEAQALLQAAGYDLSALPLGGGGGGAGHKSSKRKHKHKKEKKASKSKHKKRHKGEKQHHGRSESGVSSSSEDG